MLRADVQLQLGSLDLAGRSRPRARWSRFWSERRRKTTLLRAIAGLAPIRSGSVVLDGVVLEDTATRTYVPTERRPIGVVFQNYLLFPHLSALDNIAFGLRARGRGRDAHAVARRWLERMDLTAYENAKPATLSGGQAQRSRSPAHSRRSALCCSTSRRRVDASTRREVRRDLKRDLTQSRASRIIVTTIRSRDRARTGSSSWNGDGSSSPERPLRSRSDRGRDMSRTLSA